MPDEPQELAVGESFIRSDEGDDLRIETTRSEEHLFTTTYRDAETGTLRLALQVDITTGTTAIDPRSFDAEFWTLVVGKEQRPDADLEEALAVFDDPGIEVVPECRQLRIDGGQD